MTRGHSASDWAAAAAAAAVAAVVVVAAVDGNDSADGYVPLLDGKRGCKTVVGSRSEVAAGLAAVAVDVAVDDDVVVVLFVARPVAAVDRIRTTSPSCSNV